MTARTMHRLLKPLWIFLAILFLIETWLWDHLQPVVAAVVNVVPWGRVKVWLRAAIEKLPPWAVLIVFVIPFLILVPVKFLEFWFIAHRQWIAAGATLLLAKLVGLGVAAFIFDVTRDKLLQMDWFRRLYEWVMRLRDWAHALVDPVKERIKRFLRMFAPRRAGRTFRLLRLIRRRMAGRAAA
jgi:hypothetical protein